MISTWSEPSRPVVIGHFKVRVSKTLEFLEKVCRKTGEKITMLHLVVKAIAEGIKDFPEVNGKIVFGNFVPSKQINAHVIVTLEDGKDTFIVTIADITSKSLSTIANEIKAKKESLINGSDSIKYKESAKLIKSLPTCVLGVLVDTFSALSIMLGIKIPGDFVNDRPHATFMVNGEGMDDVDVIYPPLVGPLRTPVVFIPGKIQDEPFVENSQVIVEKVMNVCAALDHRYLDGVKAARAQSKIREILEDPEAFIQIE